MTLPYLTPLLEAGKQPSIVERNSGALRAVVYFRAVFQEGGAEDYVGELRRVQALTRVMAAAPEMLDVLKRLLAAPNDKDLQRQAEELISRVGQ